MKLLFRRQLHKDTKGFINRQTVTKFLLHARLQLTPEEIELTNTYRLGSTFIWERSDHEIQMIAHDGRQPFPETIRVDRLTGEGVNVVFETFVFMLNAQDEIRSKCAEFAKLLQEAKTLDREVAFEF